jgi:hypothetical protein
MRAWLHFLVILSALGACGDDGMSQAAGDDPGTGTRTLRVTASACATPNLINARTPTDFQTDFSARITLAQQTVTSGLVTVSSVTGKVPLTYRDGSWHGSAASYDEVYTLDVTAGEHVITGARIDGPDIQTITAPTQGSIVDTSRPVMLRWDRKRTADHTVVQIDPSYTAKIPDSGSFVIEPGALRADRSLPRQNTVHLIRTNTLEPAGAVTGSSFDVELDNEVDIEAQPLQTRW